MIKKGPTLIALIVITMAIGAAAYHYLGNHNCIGSRSYFLEQRIRNLLFYETHEPADYSAIAEQYETLLSQIRFDNSRRNYTAKYTKALQRTRLKAKATLMLTKYESSHNTNDLLKAWQLLHGEEYRTGDEYGDRIFYFKEERITADWIDRKLKLTEPTAASPSVGP
jgi:hypothetical protein